VCVCCSPVTRIAHATLRHANRLGVVLYLFNKVYFFYLLVLVSHYFHLSPINSPLSLTVTVTLTVTLTLTVTVTTSMAAEAKAPPGFRLSAKKVFLTYARCEESKADLLTHLKSFGLLVRYVVAREKHKPTEEDPEPHHHLHAVLDFSSKIDTRDERFFDFRGHHPNIQKCRSYENSATYAMKDGDFLTATTLNIADPTNYRKRKEDFKAWETDNRRRGRDDVKWPIKLLNGAAYNPTTMGKKRHLWIVGEPDVGKSTWVQNVFANKKVFLRSATDYPYEGYEGESVIILDDQVPTWNEFTAVGNVYKIETHVFGKVRYTNNYWPLNTQMTMIVLSNDEPNYGTHQAAFDARFNVVRIGQADVDPEFAFADEPFFPLPEPDHVSADADARDVRDNVYEDEPPVEEEFVPDSYPSPGEERDPPENEAPAPYIPPAEVIIAKLIKKKGKEVIDLTEDPEPDDGFDAQVDNVRWLIAGNQFDEKQKAKKEPIEPE